MKMTPRYAAALAPLFAVCIAAAADEGATKAAAPMLPTVSVQAVTTDDSSGYATWIAKSNEAFKAAGGPENFTHVYEGVVAGDETGMVFAVRFGSSAVELAGNSSAIMKVAAASEVREHLTAIRKLGAAQMMKAVRFEGGYPGEWLFITDVQVTDEAAYARSIDALRGLLDSHGLKDAKINVFRVVAGRKDHSHEVVISTPSHERVAALIDGTMEPWFADWVRTVASNRTVVSNGVYHEISK
jgi:uncharacterized protein (DUF1330 family)